MGSNLEVSTPVNDREIFWHVLRLDSASGPIPRAPPPIVVSLRQPDGKRETWLARKKWADALVNLAYGYKKDVSPSARLRYN